MISSQDTPRLPLDQIDVGKRFRKQFDEAKQAELDTSIKEKGLIHPIAVLDKSKIEGPIEQATDPSRPYLLLAGERRYRAHVHIGAPDIMVRVFDHMLHPDELREIELMENIQREGLTWKEEVALKKEIHELQVRRKGVKVARAADAPGHSIADTAKLLGESKMTTTRDITLASAMEKMPELREAKTKADAQKKLDQIKKQLMMEELARRQRAQVAASPEGVNKKKLSDSYIIMDFFKGVRAIQDKTIDFVEIDPPYGIDLHDQKRGDEYGNNNTRNYNEVPRNEYEDFMKRTLAECWRVMRDNSWGICWFGPEPWFEYIHNWILAAGKPDTMSIQDWVKTGNSFRVRRLPMLWIKPQGQTQQPNLYMANAYEMAFYFRKGTPGLVKPGRRNWFDTPPVPGEKKYHPTQRPIRLMEDILETFTVPGQRVLVPFAGSGATLLAAANKGLIPIGYDLSQPYKDAFDNRAIAGTYGQYED